MCTLEQSRKSLHILGGALLDLKLPKLQNFAVKILSQVTIASAFERNWST